MNANFKYLKILKKPGANIISLLEANVIGTPDKSMTYRQLMVREKLNTLPGPTYAVLSLRDKIQGAVCFSRRRVYNGGCPQTAFYIRYFTFLEQFRANADTDILRHKRKKSPLREEVVRLMNGEGLEYTDELLLYAYVDKDNIRSRRLIEEFGFEFARSLRVLTFTHLFPRHDGRVKKLSESHEIQLNLILRHFYYGYRLASFDGLMGKGSFYAIEIAGELVCGVQAVADAWEIMQVPGPAGRMVMKVIPRIPLLRRLFRNPYRFVIFDNVFYTREGRKHLPTLFSAVLAGHGLNTALLCLDPASGVYNALKSMNMGIVHKLMGGKRIELVVKWSGFKINKRQPVYVGGYDVL